MPEHILPYNNKNKAIVNNHSCTPEIYFNNVRLKKGETFIHHAFGYETVCVIVHGSVDIEVKGKIFSSIGNRKSLFEGKPEGVYVPLNTEAKITCLTDSTEI